MVMPLAVASFLALFAGGTWGLFAPSVNAGDSAAPSVDSPVFAGAFIKATRSRVSSPEGCLGVSSPSLEE
jgi:hypothetical protein